MTLTFVKSNSCSPYFLPDVSIELRECNKSSAGDSGHISGKAQTRHLCMQYLNPSVEDIFCCLHHGGKCAQFEKCGESRKSAIKR